MTLGTWSVVDNASGVHSIPEDDLIEHTATVDCFCNPIVQEQGVAQTEYLWVRKLVCHNAMDGRE